MTSLTGHAIELVRKRIKIPESHAESNFDPSAVDTFTRGLSG